MPPPNCLMTDLIALRRYLKQARQALSDGERRRASLQAISGITGHPQYRRARHLALYIGSKGELDPLPLLDLAIGQRKRCYLPVLHPFLPGRLWFCSWQPGEPLKPNRFGIPEPLPTPKNRIAARDLDLVIVPLLGFDDNGHRLGMGGGYYDRSFAFVRRVRKMHRPFMLGFAHEVQRIEALQQQPWDVPLDAVATNAGIHVAPRRG